MKPLKFNMSKFRKVGGDKDTVVMEHEGDKHQIHIRLKSLSPEMRKQFSTLESKPQNFANGGEVGQPCQNPNCKSVGKVHPNCRCHQSMAKGGEVGSVCALGKEHYDDCKYYSQGGEVSDDEIIKEKESTDKENSKAMEDGESQKPYSSRVEKKLKETDVTPARMADGGDVESPDTEGKSVTININGNGQAPQPVEAAAPQELPPVPAAMSNPNPGAQFAASQSPVKPANPGVNPGDLPYGVTPEDMAAQEPVQPQAIPAQSPQPAPEPKQASTPSMASGIEQQIQGEQEKAKAIGDLGQEQSKIQAQSAQAQQQLMERTDAIHKNIQGEMDNIIKDLNDHPIVAKGIYDNQNTGQQIQTAIGLILGGIGGGLTGQENPALKFISQQLDRDLQAQIKNKDNKQNLVSAYLKEYGNITDATNMARLTLSSIAVNKLEQAAAKAQSPMAKANADIVIGPLKQQINMMTAAFAQGKAGQSDTGGEGGIPERIQAMRFVNPAMAKSLEERYVPGVGLSTIPVSNEARQQIIKQTNLVNSTKSLRDWAKKNSASVDPTVRAEGKALAAELQQIYRQGVGASTSKEEQEIIEKIISSDPAQLLSKYLVDPKLKALEHSMTRTLDNVKKQSGLPVETAESKLPPEQQKYLDWARKNPNNPKAALVFKRLGIQ